MVLVILIMILMASLYNNKFDSVILILILSLMLCDHTYIVVVVLSLTVLV